MPLATLTKVAPQRNTLEGTITSLNTDLVAFDTTYLSGATPVIPTPPELARLITEGARLLTVLGGLGAAHDHATIEAFNDSIVVFRDDIDNAQALFVGHEAEWRTDIMAPAKKMEKQSNDYLSKASGMWVRRQTRKGLDTVGLTEHNRTATKKFIGRHKGVALSTIGAGAVLWGALSMDGCQGSSAGQNPPEGDKTTQNDEHFRPVNKEGDAVKKGAKYNGEGVKFSVGGFLNASKTTFANGSTPEAQAFQGVWNYIAEHSSDQKKWRPGEQYHIHTTPSDEEISLGTSTHYDINAYTISHGGEIIEITWQKDHGQETSTMENGIKKEELPMHTWRFTMNSNGTISKTDVYHDGRGEEPRGVITKIQFQGNLKDIQGF